MKILLLGGTGAMGMPLANMLKKRGDEVYITSRSSHLATENLHYIQGDAHDMRFVDQLLKEKWDAIVDFMIYESYQFPEVAKRYLSSTAHYIFISSSRVYAESASPLTEKSPRLLDTCTDERYLRTDEYALRKARAENVLLFGKNINFTIVRPYITYNKYRLQLCEQEKEYWLYRVLNNKTIVCSEDIFYKTTNLTYGNDVAKALTYIIGNDKTCSEVFHIVSDTHIAWKDVYEIYAQSLKNLGFKVGIKLIPHSFFLDQPSSSFMVTYDRLYNRVFDNSKIKALMKKEQFELPVDGLKKCIEDFVEAPMFKEHSLYDEAKRDKITKEWISLDECRNLKQLLVYLKYRIL